MHVLLLCPGAVATLQRSPGAIAVMLLSHGAIHALLQLLVPLRTPSCDQSDHAANAAATAMLLMAAVAAAVTHC